MKKPLLIGAGVLTVFIASGCSDGYRNGGKVQGGEFEVVGQKGEYDILRDVETGCHYFESDTQYVLSPVYGKDGKIAGCGEENE